MKKLNRAQQRHRAKLLRYRAWKTLYNGWQRAHRENDGFAIARIGHWLNEQYEVLSPRHQRAAVEYKLTNPID